MLGLLSVNTPCREGEELVKLKENAGIKITVYKTTGKSRLEISIRSLIYRGARLRSSLPAEVLATET